MVRVAHQKSGKHGASASKPSRGHRAFKQQDRSKHKIVIEDLTGDKKKPQRTLLFDARPPPGFTFIPAGNPEFTSALKQWAKKRNLEVLAVTTTPHAARYELSREVHRVGFHFPTVVVEEVCKYYGVELMKNGRLREDKDDDDFFRRIYHGDKAPREQSKPDQVTINTDAKQIIKDLFPNIPDNDLFKIIKTAFQLGDRKVGTADEIPLVRRAQLSVVAHIRHTYTNYDKLLRKVDYLEARQLVEEETLQKLVTWRGDNEDTQAMDEVLREVVVISDDEEDSEEGHDQSRLYETEEVQIQPTRRAVQLDGMISHRPQSPIEIVSDEESSRRYRYLPQSVRRAPTYDQSSAAVARQQSRYARWAQVRHDFRNIANPSTEPQILHRIAYQGPSSAPTTIQQVIREPIYKVESGSQWPMDPPARIVQREQPTFVRGADGKLYERIVTTASYAHTDQQPRRVPSPPVLGSRRYDGNSKPDSPTFRPTIAALHRRIESFDGDSNVLPSIETPHAPLPSPSPRRNPFENPQYRPSHVSQASQHVLATDSRPGELPSDNEHLTKRRRVEMSPPALLPQHYMPSHRAVYQDGGGSAPYGLQDNTGTIQRRIVSDGEYYQSVSSQYMLDRRPPPERVLREGPINAGPLSLQDNGSARYEIGPRQLPQTAEAPYAERPSIVRPPFDLAPESEHRSRVLPYENRQRMYPENYASRADPATMYRSLSDKNGRGQYEAMQPSSQAATGSFVVDPTYQYESRSGAGLASERDQDRSTVYISRGLNDTQANGHTLQDRGNYGQRMDSQSVNPLRDDYQYRRTYVPN